MNGIGQLGQGKIDAVLNINLGQVGIRSDFEGNAQVHIAGIRTGRGHVEHFIGAVDLVERDNSGTIIITDFKTSARAYSNDEVDRNFQLTLYQMAYKEKGYSDAEILLRFDCLIKTKQPKFESYYTTRGDADEIRARRKITEVSHAISKGIFIPNDGAQNWKCKNCSFKKNCDAWFMEEAA